MREDDIRPKALLDEFFARLKRDADRLATRRSGFVEVACVFCDRPGAERAFEKEGFPYCRCPACRSLFASPRPTPALLREYHETSEAIEFWGTHFYRETAEARRAQIFRLRAFLCRELAAKYGLEKDVHFADVGAGYALFLSELEAAAPGWALTAVEPDQRLAAVCRDQGFATIERWVEDVHDGEFGFDFISAFEVMEHVFEPVAFLAACMRLLRPGGIALVTTLAISGFDLQVLGEASRSISPPQHLNFPAVKALGKLASRTGLELVDMTTPGSLDIDIVRNVLISHPRTTVPAFARTLALADEATRLSFQTFLVEQRLSSHVRCVFRRPD